MVKLLFSANVNRHYGVTNGEIDRIPDLSLYDIHDVDFIDVNDDGLLDVVIATQAIQEGVYVQVRKAGQPYPRFVEVSDEVLNWPTRNFKTYAVKPGKMNDDDRDDLVFFGTIQPKLMLQTDQRVEVDLGDD